MIFNTKFHFSLIIWISLVIALTACSTAPALNERGVEDVSERPELAARPETSLSIRVEEDIFYKEGRTLDIYAPEEDAVWPIVILFHGGGGNSKSLAELSASIASNGVIVIVPTWNSLPPHASYITKGWEEVTCSLRYAHSYAIENGIAGTRVIIAGHSAGGASGFVALVAADELTGDCSSTENPLEADAFIGLDGAYVILDHVPASRLEEGDPEEWERINTFHYIDEAHYRDNVEIILISSEVEELQIEAEKLKEAIENVGFSATHHRMPEFDHFGVASPYPKVMEIILGVIYPN